MSRGPAVRTRHALVTARRQVKQLTKRGKSVNVAGVSPVLAVNVARSNGAPSVVKVLKLAASVDKRLMPGNFNKIAKRAKLSRAHVTRLLRGIRGASFHVAKRVADAASVTLDELYAHVSSQPGLVIKGRRTLADPRPVRRPVELPGGITVEQSQRFGRTAVHQRYVDELARRAAGTTAAGTGRVQSV